MTKKYDVVLFTDTPSADWFSRGYGAYRLASEIRQHGYSVLTIDFSSSLDWKTFTTIIDASVSSDTLMVGFSTTWFPYRHKAIKNPRYVVGPKSLGISPDIDFDPIAHSWYYDSLSHHVSQGDMHKYVEYIKSVSAKTKVVVGGAKANEYIMEKSLDNVFIGYSENMIIDYMHSLSGKGPKRIFNKVINYDVKAQTGSFDFNKSKTAYVDTDCLRHNEILTFEFSRGCIFNCSFCSYPHRNQDTRDFVKYKEVIRSELLDNWEKYGVYRYVVTDDTFNDYTAKLVLIKEVIETLPFKPEFWTYIRLDLLARNPEQAQLLKDIGVKEIYFGLETWNNKTAKRIKKGGDLQRKIEGMKIAKACWGDDVHIMSGIVVGLPEDTIESLEDSCKWYIEEGHKYVDLFAYVSLTLYHEDDTWEFKFLSDIESDLVSYKYSFKDPINQPMEWVREDSGDITSKEQADNLMVKYNKQVFPYHRESTCWNWKEVYDRSNDTATNLYYEHVMKHYWPQLISKLTQQPPDGS